MDIQDIEQNDGNVGILRDNEGASKVMLVDFSLLEVVTQGYRRKEMSDITQISQELKEILKSDGKPVRMDLGTVQFYIKPQYIKEAFAELITNGKLEESIMTSKRKIEDKFQAVLKVDRQPFIENINLLLDRIKVVKEKSRLTFSDEIGNCFFRNKGKRLVNSVYKICDKSLS